jgi:hypothetical protein
MVLIVFLITSFLIGGTSKGEDLSLTVDVQLKVDRQLVYGRTEPWATSFLSAWL